MSRIKYIWICVAVVLFVRCGFYSFSGTSISANIHTVSIAYIENKAPRVNPSLSNTLTEQLKDKYMKLTRLEMVDEEGDFDISGEVTRYDNMAMAVTANEVAAQNRLTITVKIRFKNRDDAKKNFEKEFSKYMDYSSTQSLDEVEAGLVDDIVELLVEEIFNATAASWD